MAELLKITVTDDQKQTVSGRALHMFLGIETRYNDWFSRMVGYGFDDGKDFYSNLSKTSDGGRPSVDHIMTLDMAKELCMLARNEKGRQARQYFLEVERQWNSPEMVMKRALEIANNRVQKLQAAVDSQRQQLTAAAPKVLFADSVATSQSSILVGQLAKIIKQNGYDIGQNRLFEWLRQHNYLGMTGNNRNLPTQKAMELKLFEIKESTHVNGDGVIVTTRTPKVTGKGQLYFVNKFLGREQPAV